MGNQITLTEYGGLSRLISQVAIPHNNQKSYSEIAWLLPPNFLPIQRKVQADILGLACVTYEMITGASFC